MNQSNHKHQTSNTMSLFPEDFEMSGHDKFWLYAVIGTIMISMSFGTFQLVQMIKGSFFPSKVVPARKSGAIEPSSKKGDKYRPDSNGTTTGSAPQELRDTRSRGVAKKR